MYIRSNITYERRVDLEALDSHVMIVDVLFEKLKRKRKMNIYRSFNPHNCTPLEIFRTQCDIRCNAYSPGSVILGDFNLDYNKKHDVNYCQHHLFELFDDRMDQFSLIQLVKHDTWSQMVGTTLRSSLLDHVYTSDADCVQKVESIIM